MGYKNIHLARSIVKSWILREISIEKKVLIINKIKKIILEILRIKMIIWMYMGLYMLEKDQKKLE